MTDILNTLYAVGKMPEWLGMAKDLQSKLNWRAAYWITRAENHDAVVTTFPDVVAHPVLDLSKGLPAANLEENLAGGLGQDDLDAAHRYEAVSMDLMDRIDLGGSFSYQERQRLFHKLLIYWLTTIERLDLKVAIFNTPPHSIGEYIAYAAFQMRDLKTRIFRLTSVNGLHIVCDSIDYLPHTLKRAYEERVRTGNVRMSEAVRQSLDCVRNASSNYRPWYVEQAVTREERREKAKRRLQTALEKGEIVPGPLEVGQVITSQSEPGSGEKMPRPFNIMRRQRKLAHEEVLRHAYKLPGRALTAEPMTKWEFATYRDWAFVHKVALEQRYNRLAAPADLCCDYVYFPMHYQPERTTCPDGGRFSNQYLAISLIADALPEGWRLYVKEHPSQFSFHGQGELCRWEGYYDDLAALPNVSFVPLDASSVELTDNARAVATVTGASGWEALNRGKQVLCFGGAWYGLCRGAYRLEKREDVRVAFAAIQGGEMPTLKDVDAYAGALEDVGRTVYTNTSLSKAFAVDGDLTTNLVDLIIEAEMGTDKREI